MSAVGGNLKRHHFAPLERKSELEAVEEKNRDGPTLTTPADQLREYEKMKAAEERVGGLQVGMRYCLLSRKWFVEWQQWVGHPAARVHGLGRLHRALSAGAGLDPSAGPPNLRRLCSVPEVPREALSRERSWTKDQPGLIDNEVLLAEGTSDELREAVFENLDFEIVTEDMWNLFHSWYGGGPMIARRAVRMMTGDVQIEIHLLKVRVCTIFDFENIVSFEISRTATIDALRLQACSLLSLDAAKARIGNLEGDDEDTLEACRFLAEKLIILDVQQSDGTWGCEAADKDEEHSTTKTADNDCHTAMRTSGLDNLGNTCFMNSSVQCLANIPQLTDYFLTDRYIPSLKIYGRVTEKTGGRLAKTYTQLLKSLWENSSSSVRPWDFKELVGKFAERFTGNRQHDSMEFLEFLIDGLKEDCNKVKGTKLYVERADADGRPDADVALEAGGKFLLRNDSEIDDLLVGFFRSTLTCPEKSCCRPSIAFDPFLSLKLPIMSAERSRLRSFKVVVVPYDSSEHPLTRHRVVIPKFGSVSILIDAVAAEANIVPEDCVLAEIFKSKILKFFEDSDRLEDISSQDILFLYELEDAPSFKKPANKRWGFGGDVKDGDLVVVKTECLSDSKDSELLTKNLHGIVCLVDDDGDAHIRFDGLDKRVWVLLANLGNLQVDMAMDSDKIKIDPWDGQPRTLRELMDCQDPDWSLESLRKYWDNDMHDLEDAAESQSVQPAVCGVIVSFRRLIKENKKSYFGKPIVFCTRRDTTVASLFKQIRRELKKRDLPNSMNLWTFYKTQVNQSYDTETLLRDDREETEEEIRIGERQYFILEWKGEALPDDCPIEDRILIEEEEEEVTLDTCFGWMSEMEQLSEEDCVMCQGCKEFRQAFKKIEIWSLPPVLVLQLKRFEFTGVERQRVNTKVQFPLEGLDLKDFCLSDMASFPNGKCLRAGQRVQVQGLTSKIGQKLNGAVGTILYIDSGTGSARWCVQLDDTDDVLNLFSPANLRLLDSTVVEAPAAVPVFDLVAISKHIGDAKFGHYVAYARSRHDGCWYLFDDDDVSQVLPQEVADEQEGAYILFYIRRDCRPESWGDPEN